MFRFRLHYLLVLVVLFAAGQSIYRANSKGRPAPILAEKAIVEMSLWPTRWLAWPFRLASRGWNHYIALVGSARENETLRRRVAELELETARLREVELEDKRLRSLLEFRERLPGSVQGADVVARTDDGTSSALYLSTGSKRGVAPGSAVVGLGGVVGQVVTASRDFAKILPVTDGSSAAGAVVQRSRVQAVVKGAGRNRCRLEHVPLNSDVSVGDVVVTSGLDGIFPEGLVIGVVSRVDRPTGAFFADVELIPAAKPTQQEEVLVVTPSKEEATGSPDLTREARP